MSGQPGGAGAGRIFFRVLGPVEAWCDGAAVPVGAGRQRGVLAALLLEHNRTVPTQRLVTLLWDTRPPPTARKTLQSLVRRLRRSLEPVCGGAAPLLTRSSGYLLRLADGQLDLDRFGLLRAAADRAMAAGRAPAASRLLATALALWRGPALADVAADGLGPAAARLDELRLRAVLDRVRIDLALGRHEAVVPELRALVAALPFHEEPVRRLMIALYRSGRQAEALHAYRALHGRLVAELGVGPTAATQRLHQALLAGDGPPDGVGRTGDTPALPVPDGRGAR